MKSTISFFNISIFKQDLKQHGWIALVFFAGLLFAVPLQLLLKGNSPYYSITHIDTLFKVASDIQLLLLFSVPILTGIFLFRYIQEKKSADFVHSMPLKRLELYGTHVISGISMLVIPIWMTTGIIAIVQPSTAFYFSGTTLLNWAGIFTLFATFLFLASVVVAMVSGMSIAQGILTYIFLFLPAGVLLLASKHLEIYYFGFSTNYVTDNEMLSWSPLTRLTEYYYSDKLLSQVELLVYVFLSIFLFLLGYFLYKKRSVEVATQVISFAYLTPIFKYGVTFCTMILFGIYFYWENTAWSYFGYALGAVIGYAVAEMAIRKSWQIFDSKALKGFIVYSIASVFILLISAVDVVGYETKLPKEEDIKGVFLGHSSFELIQGEEENRNIFINNPEFIDSVLLLQEVIVSEGENVHIQSVPNPEDYENIFIAYQLQNENTMVREYTIKRDSIQKVLKLAKESPSYKKQTYFFSKLDTKIDYMEFSDPERILTKIVGDSDQIEAFTRVLKQDILSATLEELNGPVKHEAKMSISTEEDLFYSIRESYKNTNKWLDEQGYTEEITLTAKEIKRMEVLSLTDETKHYDTHEFFHEDDLWGASETITDPQKIQQALETYNGSYEQFSKDNRAYIIRFFPRSNQGSFYGEVSKNNLPHFLK
ncbi:hypothetical protein [Bacillus sp. 2205SS5-2]|uniref:hypothetical protein n=1 Tax=Bacillus sp. 2205SS5-2 TaxID=3109031 RepID=UPI0030066507